MNTKMVVNPKETLAVYLNPRGLAERLKFEPQKNGRGGGQGTLANWRSIGKGPKFLKLGKKVLYPIAEVEKWEATLKLHRSTAG